MLDINSTRVSEPDGIDVTDRLRRAFERVRGRGAFTRQPERDALRDVVCTFARLRRASGATIEATIIELKSLGREAGLDGFTDHPVDEAVRWCIGEYYRTESDR